MGWSHMVWSLGGNCCFHHEKTSNMEVSCALRPVPSISGTSYACWSAINLSFLGTKSMDKTSSKNILVGDASGPRTTKLGSTVVPINHQLRFFSNWTYGPLPHVNWGFKRQCKCTCIAKKNIDLQAPSISSRGPNSIIGFTRTGWKWGIAGQA